MYSHESALPIDKDSHADEFVPFPLHITATAFQEPSAELLLNISRSRRLIVLLSHAYLDQDWCTGNFRSDILTRADFVLYVLYRA